MESTFGRLVETANGTLLPISARGSAVMTIEPEAVRALALYRPLMASSRFLASKAADGHSAASTVVGFSNPAAAARPTAAVARVPFRKVRRCRLVTEGPPVKFTKNIPGFRW